MQARLSYFFIVVLLAFLWGHIPQSASAEPTHLSNATEQVLTLEDAYRSAVFRSETIAIAREGLIQSEDEVRRVKSFLYPTLRANLDYLQRPKALKSSGGFTIRSKSSSDLSLILTQPLYNGGRARARYRSSALGQKAEILALDLTKEELFFQIAETYYEILKAENNVEIELKEVERLKAHRRSAEKQLEVGEVTQTVLFRANAELSEAQANLIRVQNDEMLAKDQLAFLAKIEGAFKVVAPAAVALPNRPASEWTATARENRLETKRGRILIDQASEDIQFAKGSFLPTLSLELQYRRSDQDPKGSFLINNDHLALLKLEIPIFEGMLRTSELAQSRSRFRQSLLEDKRQQNEIATRVRRAVLNLSALSSELKHLKDRVRFAREAFSLASRQFELGLGINIEVLDANTALLDAERRHSNAIYDREVAILLIKKETGTFSPLAKMNQSDRLNSGN